MLNTSTLSSQGGRISQVLSWAVLKAPAPPREKRGAFKVITRQQANPQIKRFDPKADFSKWDFEKAHLFSLRERDKKALKSRLLLKDFQTPRQNQDTKAINFFFYRKRKNNQSAYIRALSFPAREKDCFYYAPYLGGKLPPADSRPPLYI